MKRIVKASEFNDQLSYPLAKEIARICEGTGYTLYSCDCYRADRLNLSIITPEGRYPQVNYFKNKFTIIAPGYGDMSVEDFTQLVNNELTAIRLVRHIEDAIDRIGVYPNKTVALYVD